MLSLCISSCSCNGTRVSGGAIAVGRRTTEELRELLAW